MSRAREINGWACPTCGGTTYGVHVHDGVTPMFLGCRATTGCEGYAQSLMYPAAPVPEHVVEQTAWEWYYPAAREAQRLSPEEQDHCLRGGLLLRPLSAAGREALKARGVPA